MGAEVNTVRGIRKQDKKTSGVKVRRINFKMGTLLIVAFLLIYVPSFFYWVHGNSINTSIIQMGTIEDSINADGYIIRDEQILVSPIEGRYIKGAGEGEKVPANFSVLTVFQDSSVKLLDRLNSLDLEIMKIQEEKSQNQAFFSSDIAKIDKDVEENIRKLAIESNKNSISRTDELKRQIDALLQKKALIIGNRGPVDENLNAKKKEREAIQAQINSGTKQIVTESPGIISYNIDNYESVLTPASVNSLTPEIISQIKPLPVKSGLTGAIVKAGEPFAKVIKDFEYYIAVCIELQKIKDFKLGEEMEVRINDINKIVNGTISSISAESGGKVVVAIKVDEALSETAGLRKINVDIIKERYSGLKVPLSSLKDIDLEKMTAKIIMNEGNYAKTREVKIIGKNDEYAIIDNIAGTNTRGVSLYATYVVNPQNIEEGQMIER